MNIGIIGTGSMGRALGLSWAKAGHAVLFGSRDAAKARAVALEAGGRARAGDDDAAAAFGDVVLYTARSVPPSRLLRDERALDGKIVVDCNNSAIFGFDVPDPTRSGIHFPPTSPSLAERLAADVPRARVVKAFNTVPAGLFALEKADLAARRIAIFLCSDDADAKSVVRGLAEELGFVGVDTGELERAQLVEALADFVRLQMLAFGAGPYASLSFDDGRPS